MSIFDPNNPTAFNLLGNQQQQPFTISQENYQQPSTNANASGMNRNQRIGFMLAALSDAFAGRDVAGRAMERAQAIRQQAEIDRQRQEALERQKTIETLGANLTPEKQTLARLFPSEYAEYVFSRDKSPLVQIDQTQETAFQKEATKSAFRQIEEAEKTVINFQDIEGRLGILQKQIEGGLETGVLEELKTPFQRIGKSLNILSEEEAKNLDAKELFARTVNYIVPRMRVAGSGSTSDTEVQLFRESAPSLSLEEGGNLLIVGGMSAIAKYNRERVKLMNKYLSDPKLGNGDLVGFAEYADNVQGSVFKSVNSQDDFDLKVKQGNLKAGDFIYDGIYGGFRILTSEDIAGAK